MNIQEALALPYVPDPDEEEQMQTLSVEGGIIQRSEDGATFFFPPGAEEGVRIAWGRNDPYNPDYQPPHRPRRGRFC